MSTTVCELGKVNIIRLVLFEDTVQPVYYCYEKQTLQNLSRLVNHETYELQQEDIRIITLPGTNYLISQELLASIITTIESTSIVNIYASTVNYNGTLFFVFDRLTPIQTSPIAPQPLPKIQESRQSRKKRKKNKNDSRR